MSNLRSFTYLFFVLCFVYSCTPVEEDTADNRFSELDLAIDTLLLHDSIPGISIAVFDDKEILYQRAEGLRHIEDSLATNKQTVFEAASLSKTVAAYLAADLASKGELNYDSSLHTYFVDRDLISDERHKAFTARMLLSHQSGLPNWRGRVNSSKTDYDSIFQATDTLKFRFEPGSKFGYSGEGYVYLQRVMEAMQEKPFEALIQDHIFQKLQLNRSSYLLDPQKETNFATGNRSDGRLFEKRTTNTPLAAASLHTTATDFAQFMIDLIQQSREKPAFAELFEPQVEVVKTDDYTVSWGLGVGLIDVDGKKYAFHWGDNYIFKAYYIYSFEENLGVAYFINQENGLAIRDLLVAPVFNSLPPMYPDDY